jgi:hypothetical protein
VSRDSPEQYSRKPRADILAVDLSEEEFQQIEELARSTPNNRVCDQSTSFEPDYDIYQENDPEMNDKVQFSKGD